METSITIDWISVTDMSGGKTTDMPDVLGGNYDEWEARPPMNRYNRVIRHKATGTLLMYHTDRKDMGRHIIYSGKTIKFIERDYNMNGIELLNHHIDSGHMVARIDIALDFYDTGIPVSAYRDAMINGDVITKLKSCSEVKKVIGNGHTLYIGSTSRRKQLVRVYDKGAELGIASDIIRVEVQYMGKFALRTAKRVSLGTNTIRDALSCVLTVVDFPTLPHWVKTMNESDAKKITFRRDKESESNTDKWLRTTVFKSIERKATVDIQWWLQFKLAMDARLSVK